MIVACAVSFRVNWVVLYGLYVLISVMGYLGLLVSCWLKLRFWMVAS